jgi:filamentous hemagglutinin family protein
LWLPVVLARADVVLDGSLGPEGPAPRNAAGEFEIGESLGQRRGANLFHSFSELNLGSSQPARFTADLPLERVIGRVTSGSPSLIRGRIVSEIAGADLFLLNPAGVALIGPRIDVDGSFYTSTAGELEFEDEVRWSLGDAGAFTLSAAPPRAFGFLGEDVPPLAFTLSGQRPSVGLPAGATFALVGRGVQLRGAGGQRIAIEGGRVRLVAAAAGERIGGGDVEITLGESLVVADGGRIEVGRAADRALARCVAGRGVAGGGTEPGEPRSLPPYPADRSRCAMWASSRSQQDLPPGDLDLAVRTRCQEPANVQDRLASSVTEPASMFGREVASVERHPPGPDADRAARSRIGNVPDSRSSRTDR